MNAPTDSGRKLAATEQLTKGKNMRAAVLVAITFSFLGPLESSAQDRRWQTVSIPGICTFQIPPTMEIQKGTYKVLSDIFRGQVLETLPSESRAVAQPKGINSFSAEALELYARVIVDTERGSRGEYEALDAPLAVSGAELREFDAALKQGVMQASSQSSRKGVKTRVLSWAPLRIERLNGVDALCNSYTRSMNDGPPAIVYRYLIQNNDSLHTITVSYRLSEKKLWASDLAKVAGTFKFKKR